MNATHIAKINSVNQEYKVVIVRVEDGKTIVQQVKKGFPFGPTFFADSIKAI